MRAAVPSSSCRPAEASLRLGHAIVAWDGSANAARAVNEALPLLQTMTSVEIMCMRPEAQLHGRIPGFAITQHLQRHGIDACLRDTLMVEWDAFRPLVAHVRTTGAALVFIGAYTHSQVRERVFGGMTSSMLQSVPTTLFLSHR